MCNTKITPTAYYPDGNTTQNGGPNTTQSGDSLLPRLEKGVFCRFRSLRDVDKNKDPYDRRSGSQKVLARSGSRNRFCTFNSSVRIITTAPRRHTRGSEEWSSASHAGSHADSRSPEQGWFGYCPQNHDCQSIANLAQDVFLWFILVNFGSSHISAGFQTAGPEPSTIQQYR